MQGNSEADGGGQIPHRSEFRYFQMCGERQAKIVRVQTHHSFYYDPH